ncbi:MAG TPA: hypothetical protein DD396_06230 [Bacteroidetes bacterium]|jgi:hypothetical protein|nr:hypothetical protein [Bacteroidota bacterium]|tara:strand:- start:786 stop:1127 length:342 start_codon:yes stop_codon:yes gene_type:complete
MRHNLLTNVILLSLFFVLYGCNSSDDHIPEGILSQEEMVDIITNIQLMDAAQKEVGISGILMGKMQDTNYTLIFNKYNTDFVQFDSSLKVYSAHPKLLENIMDDVTLKLNASK